MNIKKYQDRKNELNLTYDDIVRLSGVSKRTIAGFFGGDPKYANPSIDTLRAIDKALGLNELEWTDEDKAEGVGSHSVKLSADEWEWLELRSELLEAGGQEYLDTLTALLHKSAEISKKKK